MASLIYYIANNQSKFFKWYFIIVILLITFSYVEGVGDIYGEIKTIKPSSPVLTVKCGYFTSLNYGIYYLFIMPLFFKAVFETYIRAYKISELKNAETGLDNQKAVNEAVEQYSSKIIDFLKKRYSLKIFIGLIILFCIQVFFVTVDKLQTIPVGWTQGWALKKMLAKSSTKVITFGKNSENGKAMEFLIQKDHNVTTKFTRVDSLQVINLSFNNDRIPSKTEFTIFVASAKLFFSVFEAIVFFYNFNMLYCLIFFIKEKNKPLLFKSEAFVKGVEDLITKISISGLCLTIYLYFRYLANIQKGSFQSFKWQNVFLSDQYTILVGTLFIPITSVALFIYLYVSETVVDIKAASFKRIISLYVPTIAFLVIFCIYLFISDPYMDGQFQFIIKPINYINQYLLK